MSGRGSCNGFAWGVNAGACGFRYAGAANTKDSELRQVAPSDSDATGTTMVWQPMARTAAYRLPWEWRFNADTYEPDWWAVIDGGNVPLIVWESENVVNADRDAENPIETTFKGVSVVSGGSVVQLAWLNETKIATLEAVVNAAAVPGWITGAWYDVITTTQSLMEQLFIEKQINADMTVYTTMTKVFAKKMHIHTQHRYQLLWLRSASQILYNHAGETLIPLALNRFTAVDVTTGQITV